MGRKMFLKKKTCSASLWKLNNLIEKVLILISLIIHSEKDLTSKPPINKIPSIWCSNTRSRIVSK